jgi:hypothetical protein
MGVDLGIPGGGCFDGGSLFLVARRMSPGNSSKTTTNLSQKIKYLLLFKGS